VLADCRNLGVDEMNRLCDKFSSYTLIVTCVYSTKSYVESLAKCVDNDMS